MVLVLSMLQNEKSKLFYNWVITLEKSHYKFLIHIFFFNTVETSEITMVTEVSTMVKKRDMDETFIVKHSPPSLKYVAHFQVGSTLTQMVSSASSGDRQHVGASALEAAQSLRTFTSTVHGVCATRKDTPVDR